MVELHKALEENAVCRSPLLDGHQTRDEVRSCKDYLKLLDRSARYRWGVAGLPAAACGCMV